MSNFGLDVSKEETVLDNYLVSCNECSWNGTVSDCVVETDQDGWENPVYEVLCCPKCMGMIEI